MALTLAEAVARVLQVEAALAEAVKAEVALTLAEASAWVLQVEAVARVRQAIVSTMLTQFLAA